MGGVTFGFHGLDGTVDDALVGFGDLALLEHLTLVLHQQFDSLDRGGSCLGDDSGSS